MDTATPANTSVPTAAARPPSLLYENGEVATISKAQWETALGNSFRIYLETLKSYGIQVEILSIAPQNTSVSVNGRLREVSVVRVSYRTTSTLSSTENTMDLSRDLRGVGQIVERTELSSRPMKSRKVQRISSIEFFLR